MKTTSLLSILFVGLLAACGGDGGGDGEGQAGDPCTTDDDCAEGLECHDHDGEMECEMHAEDEDEA